MLPFVELSNAYSYALAEFYYPTQALTMSAFAGIGDSLAQAREIRKSETEDCEQGKVKKSFDWNRCGRFLLKGMGSGVIWSCWYRLADKWSEILCLWVFTHLNMSIAVADKSGMHTLLNTIFSILLEQFVASPIIYSFWDIPVLTILGGGSIKSVPSVVRQKIVKLLIANAKLWTVANVVIYNLPLKWRVFALSITDLFWESILSSIASHDDEDDGRDE